MLNGARPHAKDEEAKMIFRLLFGLLKGLLVGGLLGFLLMKVGLASPGPLVAYLSAAVAGVVVGLIAGKPIWSEGGKIEAGLKAGFGALLAAGLMWGARSLLGNVGLGWAGLPSATLGGYAITSLSLVAAVLAGFYDADNTPSAEVGPIEKDPPKLRVAAAMKRPADVDTEEVQEAEQRKARK